MLAVKKSLAKKRPFFLRFIILFFLLGLLVYGYIQFADLGFDYEWQWNRVWRHFGRWTSEGFKPGPLCEGLVMTIAIAIFGLVLSLLIGLLLCILRLGPWPVCNGFAKVYISALRNTPLLLQLFFVYFLVSPLLKMGPLGSAILALSEFEAAYAAEIFRGALISVPKTQWEAGLSLGFNFGSCLFYIILPQALRNALPSLTNQAIAVLKDTSLVSAIAVADLTMRAQAIVAETFLAFEVWLLAGFIYLCLALCMALPALFLEKRQAWH